MKNLLLLLLAITLIGCSSSGNSVAQKRASIEAMHNKVLQDIYAESAAARRDVASSAGYAVFSNAQVNVIFIAAGGGHGVAKSKGRSTYMKMAEAGIGLGLGVKDFRVLFVFHTQEAYNNFVDNGWSFGGEADAAAKAGENGGQASAGGALGDVTIYQLTESGLALQATLKGTKYWKDDELN
ncbi:YSC84-related protein [Paraferrimonas sp. SM1919]|uniref:lipid-binding SYLF domain-containing protein n=1 Tax=Paraferrimonas sp. SM1919 TaxID=2662263 RepID=UPI0013D35941|nr:YSC84-related protein [Paraferrimonas sp. SM1919]